jgi:hypothetical protein
MAKAAAKKHDPFLVHLWDELSQSKFLKLEAPDGFGGLAATLQGKFAAGVRRAMQAALGAPVKQPRAKAASKGKAKGKTGPKAKAAAPAKSKPKSKSRKAQ